MFIKVYSTRMMSNNVEMQDFIFPAQKRVCEVTFTTEFAAETLLAKMFQSITKLIEKDTASSYNIIFV